MIDDESTPVHELYFECIGWMTNQYRCVCSDDDWWRLKHRVQIPSNAFIEHDLHVHRILLRKSTPVLFELDFNFVCLFVCLFACLFACYFFCLVWLSSTGLYASSCLQKCTCVWMCPGARGWTYPAEQWQNKIGTNGYTEWHNISIQLFDARCQDLCQSECLEGISSPQSAMTQQCKQLSMIRVRSAICHDLHAPTWQGALWCAKILKYEFLSRVDSPDTAWTEQNRQ